jgi:tetratricopeptide (TPR) repeat protein
VQHREKALKRARQRAVIDELVTELDNIRLAWEWAVGKAHAAELGRALHGLSWFYELRSWFAEGEAMMRRGVEALRESDGTDQVTLGQLMTFEGWFCFRQGRYGSTRELLGSALALLRPHGDPAALTDTLTILGWATAHMGDYMEARAYLREGLELARTANEPWMIILSLGGLGIIAQDLGEYAEAERLCREGLNEALALGSVRAVSFSITTLSAAAMALGQYGEAQALLRASFATSSAIGDYWGIGSALTQLGLIAFTQKELAEAQYMFREALATFREFGDRWSMARVLEYLGATASALGDDREAWRAYRDSWRIATEAQLAPVALDALLGLAGLAAKRGETDLALDLIAHISANPAISESVRSRAAQLRARLAPVNSSEQHISTRSLGDALEELFDSRQ